MNDIASLKLGKLPDRETTKITFIASAELNALIADYAAAYEAEYGLRESITDIIPHSVKLQMPRAQGQVQFPKLPSEHNYRVIIPITENKVCFGT